jgi:hypothetical protein
MNVASMINGKFVTSTEVGIAGGTIDLPFILTTAKTARPKDNTSCIVVHSIYSENLLHFRIQVQIEIKSLTYFQ